MSSDRTKVTVKIVFVLVYCHYTSYFALQIETSGLRAVKQRQVLNHLLLIRNRANREARLEKESSV